MSYEAGIFEEPDRDAEADAISRARVDLVAGRHHDHAIVAQWLATWGKPGRLPFREWLAARNG